jgi:hypothetical protein
MRTGTSHVIPFEAMLKNESIIKMPEPPTASDIKSLAEDLYEFVQRH